MTTVVVSNMEAKPLMSSDFDGTITKPMIGNLQGMRNLC